MNNKLKNEALIVTINIGQLREMIEDSVKNALSSSTENKAKEYVHGLKGIEKLFGVGHTTAQMYKNTFLAPACRQIGRKIVVDVNLARELFDNQNLLKK